MVCVMRLASFELSASHVGYLDCYLNMIWQLHAVLTLSRRLGAAAVAISLQGTVHNWMHTLCV
jgi:hypothetical protein